MRVATVDSAAAATEPAVMEPEVVAPAAMFWA
jgi:hypothetical protein